MYLFYVLLKNKQKCPRMQIRIRSLSRGPQGGLGGKEIFRTLFRIIRNSQSEVRTRINREPWSLVLVASKMKYIEIKKTRTTSTNQPIKIMFGQTRNVVCGKLLELHNWWIFNFEALFKDPVIRIAIHHAIWHWAWSYIYLMYKWLSPASKCIILSHHKLMI